MVQEFERNKTVIVCRFYGYQKKNNSQIIKIKFSKLQNNIQKPVAYATEVRKCTPLKVPFTIINKPKNNKKPYKTWLWRKIKNYKIWLKAVKCNIKWRYISFTY